MYDCLTEFMKYHFVYNKKYKGPYIDPGVTPQFIVPTSQNTLSNAMKKALYCELRMKPLLCFIYKTYALYFV